MPSEPHRAGRVPIHPEAFSHELGLKRKRPRTKNADHLKFIRTLPCLVCGTRKNIQAAHVRMGSALYGKRSTGLGEKPSDHWVLALCADHHAEQHAMDEFNFWAAYGIDPFATALALFVASGDDDAAELIIREARK